MTSPPVARRAPRAEEGGDGDQYDEDRRAGHDRVERDLAGAVRLRCVSTVDRDSLVDDFTGKAYASRPPDLVLGLALELAQLLPAVALDLRRERILPARAVGQA